MIECGGGLCCAVLWLWLWLWGVCSGVRYVRLAPTDSGSIKELSEYLALHLRIHEAYRRDDSNGSNYVLLENAQFAALQHVLQMCDFAQCDEHAYIDAATAAPALTAAAAADSASASTSMVDSKSKPPATVSNADYAPPALDTDAKRQLLQVFNQFVVPLYELASKRGIKSEVRAALAWR